ncbi:MAG: tetratricopeptide repeat protein [bacterium]|nr:tetratricopeptide repeat protein [bacterium]
MSSLATGQWMRLGVGLVVGVCAAWASGADDLTDARKKLDRAREQLNGASTARARGDAEAMQRYQSEATRLFDEAAVDYEAALTKNPDSAEAACGYAALLIQRGDADLAVEALDRAVVKNPDSGAVWLTLGQAHGAWGPKHAGDAEKALRRAIALEPESKVGKSALATLGAQYWEQGLYAFSRKAFERLLAMEPENTGGRIALAALDFREGNVASAASALDSLKKVSPEQAAIIDRFLNEARTRFEATRRSFPDTAEAHLAYAKLLIRTNQLPQSVAPLQRAVHLDPGNHVTWNLLGSVLGALGKSDKAREAFERSLEITPDQPRTRQALEGLKKATPAESAGQGSETPGM